MSERDDEDCDYSVKTILYTFFDFIARAVDEVDLGPYEDSIEVVRRLFVGSLDNRILSLIDHFFYREKTQLSDEIRRCLNRALRPTNSQPKSASRPQSSSRPKSSSRSKSPSRPKSASRSKSSSRSKSPSRPKSASRSESPSQSKSSRRSIWASQLESPSQPESLSQPVTWGELFQVFLNTILIHRRLDRLGYHLGCFGFQLPTINCDIDACELYTRWNFWFEEIFSKVSNFLTRCPEDRTCLEQSPEEPPEEPQEEPQEEPRKRKISDEEVENFPETRENPFDVSRSQYFLVKKGGKAGSSQHLLISKDSKAGASRSQYILVKKLSGPKGRSKLRIVIGKLSSCGCKRTKDHLKLPCRATELKKKLSQCPEARNLMLRIKLGKLSHRLRTLCACLNDAINRSSDQKIVNSAILRCDVRKNYLRFKLQRSKTNSCLINSRVELEGKQKKDHTMCSKSIYKSCKSDSRVNTSATCPEKNESEISCRFMWRTCSSFDSSSRSDDVDQIYSLKCKANAKLRSPSPCCKESSPCSKERSPCSKERSPCHKERSPCSKERSPCRKERSPCSKESSPYHKERSPCSKERSPCRKERSPCRKEKEDQKIKEIICELKYPKKSNKCKEDEKNENKKCSKDFETIATLKKDKCTNKLKISFSDIETSTCDITNDKEITSIYINEVSLCVCDSQEKMSEDECAKSLNVCACNAKKDRNETELTECSCNKKEKDEPSKMKCPNKCNCINCSAKISKCNFNSKETQMKCPNKCDCNSNKVSKCNCNSKETQMKCPNKCDCNSNKVSKCNCNSKETQMKCPNKCDCNSNKVSKCNFNLKETQMKCPNKCNCSDCNTKVPKCNCNSKITQMKCPNKCNCNSKVSRGTQVVLQEFFHLSVANFECEDGNNDSCKQDKSIKKGCSVFELKAQISNKKYVPTDTKFCETIHKLTESKDKHEELADTIKSKICEIIELNETMQQRLECMNRKKRARSVSVQTSKQNSSENVNIEIELKSSISNKDNRDISKPSPLKCDNDRERTFERTKRYVDSDSPPKRIQLKRTERRKNNLGSCEVIYEESIDVEPSLPSKSREQFARGDSSCCNSGCTCCSECCRRQSVCCSCKCSRRSNFLDFLSDHLTREAFLRCRYIIRAILKKFLEKGRQVNDYRRCRRKSKCCPKPVCPSRTNNCTEEYTKSSSYKYESKKSKSRLVAGGDCPRVGKSIARRECEAEFMRNRSSTCRNPENRRGSKGRIKRRAGKTLNRSERPTGSRAPMDFLEAEDRKARDRRIENFVAKWDKPFDIYEVSSGSLPMSGKGKRCL